MAGGVKRILLVEFTFVGFLRKPVCSLLRADTSEATTLEVGLFFMFYAALGGHNFFSGVSDTLVDFNRLKLHTSITFPSSSLDSGLCSGAF